MWTFVSFESPTSTGLFTAQAQVDKSNEGEEKTRADSEKPAKETEPKDDAQEPAVYLRPLFPR